MQQFERSGPLMDLNSYPAWAADMVNETRAARDAIVGHELFARMKEARLSPSATARFLAGTWPVIEQFPKYMARNLCKTVHGRSRGDDMARTFLMRNIRVEQHHANFWMQWAAACGLTARDLFHSEADPGQLALAHWCACSSEHDGLAAAMAATNFAIEGPTGEWAALVCSSDAYEQSFGADAREAAMAWLKVHAQYDDTHPWEALEIVCTLMGTQPAAADVAHLTRCVRNSYAYMARSLDCSLAG